jgi:hypothetical protein
MQKFVLAVLLQAVCVVTAPTESLAQAQARFSYDAVVDCVKPQVRNFPIHGEGTGRLSTDRSASLDFHSNVAGRETYDVKLGGPPTEARAGSASLRVTGRKSLRAVRDYPNNTMVVDLKLVGSTCTIKIENRLKPGKTQYTFPTLLGLAYCGKPKVTKTSCAGI